jgi:hypothetical protein
MGAVLLTGTAPAQNDLNSSAPAAVNSSRSVPWPADRNGSLPKRPASSTPAAAELAPPPPIPQSARTLHYQKEVSQLKPASAVLAPPVPAQDNKPLYGGGQDKGGKVMVPDFPAMPAPEAYFRLETEAELVARENAARKKDKRPTLPAFPFQEPLTKGAFQPRVFNPMMIETEPNYVCFARLFYEDKNAERYGWDLGPVQPLVSVGKFVVDSAIMPYRFCAFPRLRYDCSAGHCLPGDPVPYILYPPGLSVTGGLAQAGLTVALFFTVFP